MKKGIITTIIYFIITNFLSAQELYLDSIMKGADFTGHWIENAYWHTKGNSVFFSKYGTKNVNFVFNLKDKSIKKIYDKKNMLIQKNEYKDETDNLKIKSVEGDLFIFDKKKNTIKQLTQTSEKEINPTFSEDGKSIFYMKRNNYYQWDLEKNKIIQLTDFRQGNGINNKSKNKNPKDEWLYKDQLELFDIFEEEKKEKKEQDRNTIYYGNKEIINMNISKDGKFAVMVLYRHKARGKIAVVPDFVTKNGYCTPLSARTKVGDKRGTSELAIYNIKENKFTVLKGDKLENRNKLPNYTKDYPDKDFRGLIDMGINFGKPILSGNNKAAVVVRANNNKRRWICVVDLENPKLKTLDYQHDEAWIAGPGIGGYFPDDNIIWLPDNKEIGYQSESSGFSHLYIVNINTGNKKAVTKGNFEVYNPFISKDKKWWYFSANMENKGERHFYRKAIKGGAIEKLTTLEGRNDVTLSPDEKMLLIKNSTANKPWELFLQENKKGAKAVQITNSTSHNFNSYEWRKPEFITFTARDGAKVHARLYKPQKSNKAAVIFVHGAGYLQNAHNWWSYYYREYMFHNLLADKGYTILDIDYRGSAGYGRDWRTAIYRNMGGKDLTDNADGAKYLIENLGIDKNRIGIYGGSYGGFITLMAMFKEDKYFACGAALRAVTDWAHYNHGYTSNILNTPASDSLAYKRSSPIYYAEGLNKPLLILHGILDLNVHFQDVVRLSQRLIELNKENWNMAVFPVEKHSFTTSSSWTDEYRRILKLFEKYLQ